MPLRMIWGLYLLFFVGACTLSPETARPEPQVSPSVDLSPVETPVDTATPEPESSGESPQAALPVRFVLNLDDFPFSSFYPVSISLFRAGSSAVLQRQRLLPRVEGQQLSLESDIVTGERYQLHVSGSQIDGGCLTQMRLELNPDEIGKKGRVATAAQLDVSPEFFDRVIVNPNCQRVYTQSGRVRDTENRPLEGVELQLELRNGDGSLSYFNSQLSDVNGRFSIADLPVGVFTRIIARKEGYRTQSRTFSAQVEGQKIDQLESLDLVLESL